MKKRLCDIDFLKSLQKGFASCDARQPGARRDQEFVALGASDNLKALKRISLVADLSSDNLPGDDDFDAAVLLTTLRCTVVGDWAANAKALRRYRTSLQPLLDEVVAHGVSALLGKGLVDFGFTAGVAVTLDSQAKRGIIEHDAGELGQVLTRFRAEIELAGIEKYVTHIDDQPSGRVGSGQDAIELLEQAGAHGLFLTIELFGGLFLGLSRG